MQTRIQNGHKLSEMPHDQSIIEQPYGALQVCLFKRIDVHMHNEVYNKPFAEIRIHFANDQKPILVFRQNIAYPQTCYREAITSRQLYLSEFALSTKLRTCFKTTLVLIGQQVLLKMTPQG